MKMFPLGFLVRFLLMVAALTGVSITSYATEHHVRVGLAEGLTAHQR